MCGTTSDKFYQYLDGSGGKQPLEDTTCPEPGYEKLSIALQMALNQAQSGKGKERHACDNPFEEQIIMIIERLDVGYQLGQAIKKIAESKRLDTNHAINELLGAINYIAAKIIHLKEGE